jgi:hypothetical protein
MKEGGTMREGPITQITAVVFLRARSLTPRGRDRASEALNLATQRAWCREMAQDLEAVIAGEYIEYGGTGPVARRPVVQQMLADLRTRSDIRYLIVASPDRLARTPRDTEEIQAAIQASGAELVYAVDLFRSYRCNPGMNYPHPGLAVDESLPMEGGSW